MLRQIQKRCKQQHKAKGFATYLLLPQPHNDDNMTEEFKRIIKGEVCPYCNCETNLASGEIIFPEKLNEIPRPKYLDKMFYQCINDFNHYVGTYKDNLTSLGRLADTELRRLRNKGHNIFDPLWNEHKLFNS